MPSAYILLNSKPDSELGIISKVKDVIKTCDQSAMYEIQGVYGVYDIVVKVECSKMGDVSEILRRIRRVEKVISTITMLVIEEQ